MNGPDSGPLGRTQGRRTAPSGAGRPGRTAVFGAMVVALTAAVLTLAGTTPRGVGAPVQNFERVERDERTFVCPGGIPGATASHGNVEEGLAAPQPLGTGGATFTDDKSVAVGAFAAQESRTRDWLAWQSCPEPRSRWWFVGAGAATVAHDTVLTVSNPRAGQAVVDIDVFGRSGAVEGPGLHGITVPGGSAKEFDLAEVAPAIGDLAVSVTATRGLVAVTAADRFAPGVLGKPVQEWLPAQPVPATDLTLAGFPRKPDRATLVVANPRDVEAIVTLGVIGRTGTFAPKDVQTLTVGPDSVETVSIRSVFDGEPFALRVTAEQPVAAAVRTVTGGDVSFATGVRPVRGTTAVAVPAGSGQLVLSSPQRAAAVQLTAFDAAGKEVLDRAVPVAEATSVGLRLPQATRFVRLVADRPGAVAGFSVTGLAGTAAAGVTSAIGSVLLPVVRPSW